MEVSSIKQSGMQNKIIIQILVRLEFEIKLEPLLLYSSAATVAPSATPPPALFKIRLVLQTPTLVHTLGGP